MALDRRTTHRSDRAADHRLLRATAPGAGSGAGGRTFWWVPSSPRLRLIAMPNSSTVWMAAGLLWILDASINITMEPFRAFVGDMLPQGQRKSGFAMQSLLIGFGAVLSSALPYMLTNWIGVTRIGIGRVLSRARCSLPFTSVRGCSLPRSSIRSSGRRNIRRTTSRHSANRMRLQRGWDVRSPRSSAASRSMPTAMKQLAVVQFFTWFAMFCMWIYFVPAVATVVFGGVPGSPEYQRGNEWGGVCFSVYNGTAFVFAFVLLALVRRFTPRSIHRLSLLAGGAGLILAAIFRDQYFLLGSMVLVGVAWASILSMPYAMLSNAIPAEKMGFYMGVFNFFIVLPQILASAGLGVLMTGVLGENPMHAVVLGGCSMIVAGLSVGLVSKQVDEFGSARA